MKDLRAWMAKSPHLHSIQQDDVVLKTFLRGCKFSMERTKEKLDNFHAVKGELPEWFDNWDPNLPLAQVLKLRCWVGESTFHSRALTRRAGWCSSVGWRR